MADYDYLLPPELEDPLKWLSELLKQQQKEREALIVHHTGGSTLNSALDALKGRGLTGYNWFVDPSGELIPNPLVAEGGFGQHMRPGQGMGAGLSNANTFGISAIAPDENSVTPEQIAAIKAFSELRGFDPQSVFGHGEVNPHKHPDEGMAIINAIRNADPSAATAAAAIGGEGWPAPTPPPTAAIGTRKMGILEDLIAQLTGEQGSAAQASGGSLAAMLGLEQPAAPRQGGLDPETMGYLAMMAKGLSPHSAIDPQQMLAQAQRQKEVRELQAQRQAEQRQNLLLRLGESQRAQEATIDQRREATEERTRAAKAREEEAKARRENTPAAQYARDWLGPDAVRGTPEWNEKIKEFYQNERAGTTEKYGVSPLIGYDKDGNPVPLQLGTAGTTRPVQLPEGVTMRQKADKVDMGTHWGYRNPITGVVEQTIPKNIEDEEAAKLRGKFVEQQKLSEAAAKPGRVRDATTALDYIDRADKMIDNAEGYLPTTGFFGQKLREIGGTAAHDLHELTNNIKAITSFDKIQEMRKNSPTGAALGPVSDFENKRLSDAVGNLETSQSKEQFRHNLGLVRRLFAETVHGPEGAAAASKPTEPTKTAVPRVGEERGGYRFKGGNPASPNSWEKI